MKVFMHLIFRARPIEALTLYIWWMHSVHSLNVASIWNELMGIKVFDVTFLPIYQFFCVHNIQKNYFLKTSTCLLLYTTEFQMILYFFKWFYNDFMIFLKWFYNDFITNQSSLMIHIYAFYTTCLLFSLQIKDVENWS